MRELKGRVAVVTGAAMGMGREVALRLHREGCALALCDIDMAALLNVKQECETGVGKGKVTVHSVDVSNREQVKFFVGAVVAEHGDSVHLLFNNAGIAKADSFDRMPEAVFDKVMAVNVDGVISTTRAFWPHLVQADEAAVVNTSSVAGFLPAPAVGIPYVTSKFAVRGFSEALALECKVIAPHVRVHVVHPGIIATEIAQKMGVDAAPIDERKLERLPASMRARFEQMSDEAKLEELTKMGVDVFKKWGYSSKEAADMIVDGVCAGKLRIMVGWDAAIIDWWMRALPTLYTYQAGEALIMLSSVVGRHFYRPFGLLLAMGWLLRRFRPGGQRSAL